VEPYKGQNEVAIDAGGFEKLSRKQGNHPFVKRGSRIGAEGGERRGNASRKRGGVLEYLSPCNKYTGERAMSQPGRVFRVVQKDKGIWGGNRSELKKKRVSPPSGSKQSWEGG